MNKLLIITSRIFREVFLLPKNKYEELPYKYEPNTIIEKLNPNGKPIQRRFYGSDGYAEFDIDLTHHGKPETHFYGPHKHIINPKKKNKRSRPIKLTKQEYYDYVLNFDNTNIKKIKVRYIDDNK